MSLRPDNANNRTSVAALVVAPVARARVHEALRGRADICFCRRCEELTALLGRPDIVAAVVDLWDESGRPTTDAVLAIRRALPALPVVAYCALTPRTSAELLRIVRAGINGLVLQGYDDLATALRAALEEAREDCTAAEVLGELLPMLPERLRPVLAQCALSSRRGLTVEALAAALGVHRKTLASRLATERLPRAGTLIAWCRLLHAAKLLEDPRRTVESVALALDFASGAALCNLLRRHTGWRVRDVRRPGGFGRVLRAVADRLGRGRPPIAA